MAKSFKYKGYKYKININTGHIINKEGTLQHILRADTDSAKKLFYPSIFIPKYHSIPIKK